VLEALDFSNEQDFEDAKRGLIATDSGLQVHTPGGGTVWDLPANEFINGSAPGSVNPSLWRQAQITRERWNELERGKVMSVQVRSNLPSPLWGIAVANTQANGPAITRA